MFSGLKAPPTAATLGSWKGLMSFSIQFSGGMQSASVVTIMSPVASMAPRSRIWARLYSGLMSTLSQYFSAISGVRSMLPLSMSMSSTGWVWRRMACRQSSMMTSSLRAGITTLTFISWLGFDYVLYRFLRGCVVGKI